MSSDLIKYCQWLHQKNMLAAADGNVSVRLDDGRILITPTGVSKSEIREEDLALVTLDNEVLRGHPSSERLMHLEVYKQCPKAKAVVHAHPPTAIAWSVARPHLAQLPDRCLSEVILAAGRIPFVPYARPGTADMGLVLREFLPECRAMILSRHGALTWGESLKEAYFGMERVEHSAEILWRAAQLGELTELAEDEVQALYEIRKNLGDKLL